MSTQPTSTGNIQNAFLSLKREMRDIRYKDKLSSLATFQNNSHIFTIPLLHFLLLEFSRHVARSVFEKKYELIGKDDLTFTKNVFRFFYFELNVSALTLTANQFLSDGFVERKILLLVTFIQAVKEAHKHMEKISEMKMLTIPPFVSTNVDNYYSKNEPEIAESKIKTPFHSLKSGERKESEKGEKREKENQLIIIQHKEIELERINVNLSPPSPPLHSLLDRSRSPLRANNNIINNLNNNNNYNNNNYNNNINNNINNHQNHHVITNQEMQEMNVLKSINRSNLGKENITEIKKENQIEKDVTASALKSHRNTNVKENEILLSRRVEELFTSMSDNFARIEAKIMLLDGRLRVVEEIQRTHRK